MRAVRPARILALSALLGLSCASPRVADPAQAVEAYRQATLRGDADALYALLTARSQRELGAQRTRELMRDGKQELAQAAKRLSDSSAQPDVVARVRFEDGESTELVLEDRVFKISAAATLPAAARTPAEALSDLRRALARRSYAALVRVMSQETRGALEHSLAAMVRGLEEPETLAVDVQGDSAEVAIPGGHVVKLKRETGVWKVEDFR